MVRSGQRPNIVLVVLDCVRSLDFPQGIDSDATKSEEFASFAQEAISFRNTVAPCPWTLPSHVSLFTGKYPWEHHVHGKGLHSLPVGFKVSAEELKAGGYRAQFLSGNPILNESTGLLRGFDYFRVADWWEPLLRIDWANRRNQELLAEPGGTKNQQTRLRAGNSRLRASVELLTSFPPVMDILNRVIHRMHHTPHRLPVSSPWIESQFAGFIEKCPINQPVFTFVNFFDAHEPYLTRPDESIGLSEWWRLMRVRQQLSMVLSGKNSPSTEDRTVLHGLYLKSIGLLVARVSKLIETLKRTGRWDDTLFIVTSDHGQAFYENGHLFHGFVLDESVIRVPLLIKYPTWMSADVDSSAWVSLVDLHDTIRLAAGFPCEGQFEPPTMDRSDALDSRSVFSFSEGIHNPAYTRRWLSEDTLRRLDKIQVAAYNGSFKSVVDGYSNPPRVFRSVVTPTSPSRGSGYLDVAESSAASADALMLYERIANTINSREADESSVDKRLSAWGYA